MARRAFQRGGAEANNREPTTFTERMCLIRAQRRHYTNPNLATMLDKRLGTRYKTILSRPCRNCSSSPSNAVPLSSCRISRASTYWSADGVGGSMKIEWTNWGIPHHSASNQTFKCELLDVSVVVSVPIIDQAACIMVPLGARRSTKAMARCLLDPKLKVVSMGVLQTQHMPISLL